MRKLNSWLGGYLEYTESSAAPEYFHLWSGIWVLSAVIQRKAWLKFSHFTLYPNFFIVLVGPPATYKSTAIEIAANLIYDIVGDKLGPDMTSIEALIGDIPSTEATFEYRGEVYKHQSMPIVVPEFATFIGEKDMNKCSTLCRLYDCADKFDKRTKTQGIDKLRNYFVTLGACSTSDQLADHLPKGAIGGGLTSRTLYIVGDPDPSRELALPMESLKEKMLKIKLLADLRDIEENIKGEYIIDKGGMVWYKEWYKNRKENEIISDPLFEHYYNRKPMHILKLSMVLRASLDNSKRVMDSDLYNACQLIDSIEPRMPEAFEGVGENPLLNIINTIRHLFKERERWHHRAINARVYKLGDSRMIDSALVQLVEKMHFIKREGEYYMLEKDKSEAGRSRVVGKTS